MYGDTTQTFINGLYAAVKANRPVKFYQERSRF